jgi:hypothetical protein
VVSGASPGRSHVGRVSELRLSLHENS